MDAFWESGWTGTRRRSRSTGEDVELRFDTPNLRYLWNT